MYMPIIGENLKKARVKSGLTQREVEKKLGLRELSLKDYETERLKLPVETAMKFSRLYHVSLDELVTGESVQTENDFQTKKLHELSSLFKRSDTELMFLDPVIRSYLEEFQDKLLEDSFFNIMTINFTEKDRKEFGREILLTLGSLMGADQKVTDEELAFVQELVQRLGLEDKAGTIKKSFVLKHRPILAHFKQQPSAKHFLIWLLFLLARSDGDISPDEVTYIEDCSETIKVNRTQFLWIKKFFIREIQ
jgi:transcriptional regulator with XRE-family HTH domain